MHLVGRYYLILLLLAAGACARGHSGPEVAATPSRAPTPEPVAVLPALTPAKIYTVGGDVAEPVEITRTHPHIPDAMQKHLMNGPPMFEAIIGIDGSVSGVRSVRPVPEGARECVAFLAAQISQWRYKPATFKGKPVPVHLTVTLFHRAC